MNARTYIIGLPLVLLLTGCSLTAQLQPILEGGELPPPVHSETPSITIEAPSKYHSLNTLQGHTLTGSSIVRFMDTGILEIGSADAPATLVIFTEYHCKYCWELQAVHFRKLREDFIAPGHLKVQIVILPLEKYPHSEVAAKATICAGQAGKGVSMHETLTSSADRSRQALVEYAEELGMNSEIFSTCLDAEETTVLLKLHKAVAEQTKTTLVPTLFLNREKKVGLPHYPDLRGWIQSKLPKNL